MRIPTSFILVSVGELQCEQLVGKKTTSSLSTGPASYSATLSGDSLSSAKQDASEELSLWKKMKYTHIISLHIKLIIHQYPGLIVTNDYICDRTRGNVV